MDKIEIVRELGSGRCARGRHHDALDSVAACRGIGVGTSFPIQTPEKLRYNINQQPFSAS